MEPRERLARVLPGLARLLDYQSSWLRPDLLAGRDRGPFRGSHGKLSLF